MPHPVKCYYCGQTFDRDLEDYVTISGKRRYAHKLCAENKDILITPKNKDLEKLETYVKQLFKLSYVHPTIQNEIKKFVENDGFSYSGILKTLYYYYDIERNRPPLLSPSIGIVEYVYPRAKEFYRILYEAQQANKDKNIEDYRNPKEVVVKICTPEREPLRRRKLFTFLDEEVEE